MNGSNQLGAVSDPPEKRAARALSLESQEAGAGQRGGQRGRRLSSGVRVARIDRARCRPQPRPPPPCHSADPFPYPPVRRGGRRERACDALPLTWPALGRSWPPAAAGGGWQLQPVSTTKSLKTLFPVQAINSSSVAACSNDWLS